MQKEVIKEQKEVIKNSFLKCFNNEDGKRVIEYLCRIYNSKTNMTNPNYNYYRDGALSVLDYINKVINNNKDN